MFKFKLFSFWCFKKIQESFFLLVKEVDQYFIFICLSSVSVMRSFSIVDFGLNTFLRVNIKPGMILHVTNYEVPLLKWSDEALRIILSSSTFDVCTPSKTCLILSIPSSRFWIHQGSSICNILLFRVSISGYSFTSYFL